MYYNSGRIIRYNCETCLCPEVLKISHFDGDFVLTTQECSSPSSPSSPNKQSQQASVLKTLIFLSLATLFILNNAAHIDSCELFIKLVFN